MDVEAVQKTALQVVFDLLLVFGLAAFEEEDDRASEQEQQEQGEQEQGEEKKTGSIVSGLSQLLDSEVL